MDVRRFDVSPRRGLDSAQVQQRIEQGLFNKESKLPTKSVKKIIRDNVLTLFNIINFILAIAVLLVGSPKSALFLGVVFSNLAIGTIQELRAKKAVDELAIISASKVKCLRDGKFMDMMIEEIVLDDIILLENGNQVPADCILIEGQCSANESLLTGESNSIEKKEGDTLLSGSFIVSGTALAKVDKVGDDNYASSIFKSAKYVKKVNSEIMSSLNKVIKVITIIILPVSVLLLMSQLSVDGTSFQQGVVNTVAGIVGMIPEGLMLLTSTVLAVSVIRLSRYKVLVQELYCIETLARVDVLCLDKTGTITDGSMELENIVNLGESTPDDVKNALCAITATLKDNNQTITAVRNKFGEGTDWKATVMLPFSSERKYSGASFEGVGTYLMGAPDFIMGNVPQDLQKELDKYTESRVLLLAHSDLQISDSRAPQNMKPVALLVISDKVRDTAPETLDYFEKQGVSLKIISGDNVKTVSNVAKQAGFTDYDNYIDATLLKNYDELREASKNYNIFGRVTPVQKRDLILALKESGHTVAMTGDGVNDVLALKESDCSVAMASGSDAARNVSEIVLLNDDFASMPKVVAEGRRSINNIQRSSTLFLSKTIYATILAVLFVFLNFTYPFEPIQLSLISTFTIGIPSFILALEPNHDRVKGSFFKKVIGRSLPTALSVVMGIVAVVVMTYFMDLSQAQASTLATIVTAFTSLLLIYRVSKPFNKLRIALFVAMCIGVFICVFFFQDFFDLAVVDLFLGFIAAVLCFSVFGFHKAITLLIEKLERGLKWLSKLRAVRKYRRKVRKGEKAEQKAIKVSSKRKKKDKD